MAIQAPRGTTDPLHSIAHGISLANESCEPRVATQAIPNIMHVSGAPFKSPAQAGYLQDTSAKTLCPWQLDRTGCTLECAFDRVLGHGGFARVYSGQVVANRPPCVNLATRASTRAAAVWAFVRPLVHAGVRLVSLSALQPLISASRLFAHVSWLFALKLAEIWGISRPCAVKVLQDTSSNKGAYGTRSIEHEVLITLHVSHACASCPFVGKAYGFEVASAARLPSAAPRCVAECPPLANPAASEPCEPDAVLLVLEPYVADLATRLQEHARHAGSGAEFPCSLCCVDAAWPPATPGCACGDSRLPPGHLLTAPVLAAKLTAGYLLDACSHLPRGVAPGGSHVASLWEYAASVRQHGLQLSVAEVLRLALELAEAISAIHDRAHVMHLDIKPQNVLLDSEMHVKLVDFGLAAAFTPERPFIILPQLGRGTRPYTAPELLSAGSSGTITPAADIYSFGCCMLTMCVNGRSGGAAGPAHEPVGLIKQGVTRCTQLAPFVPRELDAILKACLSTNVYERPSAAGIVEELRGALHTRTGGAVAPASGPAAARPLSPPPLPSSPSMPHPHMPHAPSMADLQRRYRHLRVSLDVLVPGRAASPGTGRARCARQRQHSTGITPPGLSRCSSSAYSRSGAIQLEPHSRSGASMHSVPDMCITSGDLQPGSRMPYTTSVRVGLAGISRPRHALSAQSSSDWFSEGSMSCASFPAPSMAEALTSPTQVPAWMGSYK